MSIQQMAGSRTTWINIIHPTPQDVEALRRIYPYIHPLNLADILSTNERPKLDTAEDYVFVVMHFPVWNKTLSLSRQSEIEFFIGRGYVVTIHEGNIRPLEELYNKCLLDKSTSHQFLDGGAGHAFYVLLNMLVDYVFPILRKVDQNLRSIEETVFTADAREVIREIAVLRRDIIALRRIIRQQIPIVQQLERLKHPVIQEDLEDYFGDILDHLYRARDMIDENYEIISGLSETADTLMSHRINAVMRILTVISVIMLPLTLLSSIYGMNIPLPFADHPAAFLLVNGMMATIALGMLVFFRSRKWL
ncbi:MAG: magnesium/cobalt transporter CorA [bacterium]|nr:magnesium/cobalt transporter CorA [bacterium]